MTAFRRVEYRRLPLQFYLFTFSGVWCPADWNIVRRRMYGIYTVIQVVAGIVFWLTLIINLIALRNESEYFYENLFAVSTLTYAMYKDYVVLTKRKVVSKFLEICFEDDWYEARDDYEIETIRKYEYETKLVTKAYAIGIVAALATKAITPMLRSRSGLALPMEAWYPYENSNIFAYLASYVQQLMGGIPLICLHISVDSFFVALVLQMCIQLRILKHRMEHIESSSNLDGKKFGDSEQSDLLADYVRRHIRILSFGEKMNLEFRGIMRGQVFITIPNICINVYLFSQYRGVITLGSIDSFLCFATCLMQIFLYCWYGNKIILHSRDVSHAVYKMNWVSLSTSSKKKLLTIMIRTTRSIRFAAGTFILNIDSFIEIIKASYSAFRVLQETQK